MQFTIHLADIEPLMCQAWTNLQLPPQIKISNQPVEDFNLIGTNVFVSPANSMGIMRSGIDGAYLRMFPTIENDVREAIRRIGYKNFNGDYFLPVCSALLVKITGQRQYSDGRQVTDGVGGTKNYVICCPSMLLPGTNIGETQNDYYCYKSIIDLAKKIPFQINNLILSGIGTGTGGISYEVSAKNFLKALKSQEVIDESPLDSNVVINTKLIQQQTQLPQNSTFIEYSIDRSS
jgi:O-acetyl-ADP-ribose deacetylase (regulator of RNase III)